MSESGFEHVVFYQCSLPFERGNGCFSPLDFGVPMGTRIPDKPRPLFYRESNIWPQKSSKNVELVFWDGIEYNLNWGISHCHGSSDISPTRRPVCGGQERPTGNHGPFKSMIFHMMYADDLSVMICRRYM